jgi:hypothetical protein
MVLVGVTSFVYLTFVLLKNPLLQQRTEYPGPDGGVRKFWLPNSEAVFSRAEGMRQELFLGQTNLLRAM